MKKLFITAAAAVLALALGLGVVTYRTTTKALLLSNIEALTNKEDTGGGTGGSNNEGDGSMFHYKHLQGRPVTCVIYRNVDINGGITLSETDKSVEVGWTSIKLTGVMEICPKDGEGCTVYSCQTTN